MGMAGRHALRPGLVEPQEDVKPARFMPQGRPGIPLASPGLLARKWLDPRTVIPAKAGIQRSVNWIPAFAGKTRVRRECRTTSRV